MKRLLLSLMLLQNPQAEPNFVVRENVTNNMLVLYDDSKREIPLCLEGIVIGNNFIVTHSRLPYILESNKEFSTYMMSSCYNIDYLGTVHNHIGTDDCIPSKDDVSKFMLDKNAFLEVIACNPDLRKQEIDLAVLFKSKLSENYNPRLMLDDDYKKDMKMKLKRINIRKTQDKKDRK